MRVLPTRGLWTLALLCIGCGGPPVDLLVPPFQAELGELATEADQAARPGVAGIDDWVFSARNCGI